VTLGVIEFNDQSLLIQAEDETRYSEPGFARLTDHGIISGEEAREQAWRDPLHMYNQYWCHLNQTPLAHQHRFARHHGDIAFAQLKTLWDQAGSPEELILLPPGSFTRAQLSLLLGLVEALPAKTCAVVDSALAACLDVDKNTIFIDLHQHESVVVVCGPGEGLIRILDEEVFPGVGMSQIYNSVARHISDALIENYRFDPLHSSETEQAIYDQIPHWLTRLGWEQDISITLDSDKGELPCILNRDAIKLLIQERLTSLYPFMREWPGCDIVVAHNSGVLATLVDEFSEARVARHTAGVRRVLERKSEILEQIEDVYRVRELARTDAEKPADGKNGTPLATHLLCGGVALPLSKPLSIRLAEDGPSLANEVDPDAALTVVRRSHQLETLHSTADTKVPRTCLPGESIQIGGHELRLIRVSGD
jgi:hypothetical protein